MSLFQCEKCGCIDNSATSTYNVRDRPRLMLPEYLGKALCCVCGPTTYPDGSPMSMITGEWHNIFERDYLPLGEWTTDQGGVFKHIQTGSTDYESHVIKNFNLRKTKILQEHSNV